MTDSNLNIQGDPTRQAMDSLRGYAYQIIATALAWMALRDDELLFVEVAEDYAVATKTAMTGTQVRDTAKSGSFVLTSDKGVETINSLIDLQKRNPGKRVVLRYLTTSPDGKEREKKNQINGESGVAYWRAAAASADVGPLRKKLLNLALSDDAKALVQTCTDQQLREKLLRRIFWDTKQSSITGLKEQLDEALVLHGEKTGEAAQTSRRVSSAVVQHILYVAIAAGERRLNRAGFLRLFDEHSKKVFSDNQLAAVIAGSGADQGAVTPLETRLRNVTETPMPAILATRTGDLTALDKSVRDNQFVWLHAGAGYGKSLLSIQIAQRIGGYWAIARLRNLSVQNLPGILNRIAAELELAQPHGLILDDLDHFFDDAVKVSLANIFHTANRSNSSIVVTASRKPSLQLLSALGKTQSATHGVGGLTESEVGDFIKNLNGDPSLWGRYVHVASVTGHPQIAHAIALGLALKGWPESEFKTLPALNGSDEELELLRTETRQRLVNDLPEQQRALLYRLSLLLGRFDRAMAKEIGSSPPPISSAGEDLDFLIGPWIDQTRSDEFRISPLISNSGLKMLSSSEVKEIHHKAASVLTAGLSLPGEKIDAIFVHALAGANELALQKLAAASILTSFVGYGTLANVASVIKCAKIDQAIYPDNGIISIQLRLVQCLFLIVSEQRGPAQNAWKALEHEIDEYAPDDMRVNLRFAAYGKAMTLPGMAVVFPDFANMILLMRDLKPETKQELIDTGEDQFWEHKIGDPLASLYPMQLTQIASIVALEKVIEHLASLSSENRAWLLQSFERPEFDRGLCLKSPWLHEVGAKSIKADKAARIYQSIATICEQMGEIEFAVEAVETAAVIHDESLDDQEKARVILAEAQSRLGSKPNLIRAEARTYLHERNYEKHLKLIETIVDTYKIDNGIEQSYLRRECGVSHANLGDWKTAAKYFLESSVNASNVPFGAMEVAAVGLLADAAVADWKSGEFEEALRKMSEVLNRLSKIDPDDGLKAMALHRIVRHTILWMEQDCVADEEGKAEQDFHMVPGANSNPSPHDDLATGELGVLETAWYLLELAERDCGVDAGIGHYIDNELDPKLTITGQEIMRMRTAWRHAFKHRNGADLQRFTMPKLDAQQMITNIGAKDLLGNLTAPIRGAVKKMMPAELEACRRETQISVFGFFGLCGMSGRHHEMSIFLTNDLKSERPLFTNEDVVILNGGDYNQSDAQKAMLGCVGLAVKYWKSGDEPALEDLFHLSFRWLMIILKTECRHLVEAALCEWFTQRWRIAVEKQGFRFRTPMQAKPAMVACLDDLETGAKGLAQILTVAEHFVPITVPGEVMQQLRALIAE